MIKIITPGLLLLLFTTQFLFSQEKLSENQKLETIGKVWGFLKYYHPNVAKGLYDWDNQLITKIKTLEKIETKKQFNNMLYEWIDSLGKVDLCTKCNEKNDKKYFLKNFDLSWTDDKIIFTTDVIEKLNFIENNRNLDGDFYFTTKRDKDGFFGVQNETFYAQSFPEKEIRLVELFRYWNLIEYFFPYKYQTDQNWNDVLKEMIPKYIMAKNQEQYTLTTLELLTKTDDSHVLLKSNAYTKYIFGIRQVPAEYKIAENKIVITSIPETKSGEKSELLINDVITEINGQSIQQILDKTSKYIPASNSWGKLKKIKNLLLNSNEDFLKLKIERNGITHNIEAKTYLYNEIIRIKKKEPEKWKFLDADKKIGYVNIGTLTVADVEDMFDNLKHTEAVIFDVRNYPNLTLGKISQYFLPNRITYYTWSRSDTTYPGKYYQEEGLTGKDNPDYYKGKVIALVNEITQSQAETLTMMLKQNPTTKVIGSNTSGANGNVIKLKIMNIGTMFSGLGAFYPDGRETQRIGIVPDIEVKPTIKGIQENRDEVLDRALEYIKKGN